jgi:hypothetical protein
VCIILVARERARARNSNDEWLHPTLLGAAFDAGDVEKAQEFADQVSEDGPAAWKLDTCLSPSILGNDSVLYHALFRARNEREQKLKQSMKIMR